MTSFLELERGFGLLYFSVRDVNPVSLAALGAFATCLFGTCNMFTPILHDPVLTDWIYLVV